MRRQTTAVAANAMAEQQMDTLNDDKDEAIAVLMLTRAIPGIINDGDGSSEGRVRHL